MTFRPEIWTRQIGDTTLRLWLPTCAEVCAKLEEIRKPEGNGWDWMTAVAIV